MTVLDGIELGERSVHLPLKMNHPAVGRKANRIAGCTIFEHLLNIGKRGRSRHLGCLRHKIKNVVSGLELVTFFLIQMFDLDASLEIFRPFTR